jgi:hypothetical protein
MALEARLRKLEAERDDMGGVAPTTYELEAREVDAIVTHFFNHLEFESPRDDFTPEECLEICDFMRAVITQHAMTGSPLKIPEAVTQYILDYTAYAFQQKQLLWDGCPDCALLIPRVNYWYRHEHLKPFEECPGCGADLGTKRSYHAYRDRHGRHPHGLVKTLPLTFEACVTKRNEYLAGGAYDTI